MWRMVILGLLACASCDKGKAPTAVGSRPDRAGVAATDEVARLVAEPGGALSIDAQGRVVRNGTELATLSPGGELTSGGTLIATIDEDGRVDIMGWGPGLALQVRADGGVIDQGAVVLEPRADGTLTGPMMDEPELRGATLRLEGARDRHRAVVFAWLALARTDRR